MAEVLHTLFDLLVILLVAFVLNVIPVFAPPTLSDLQLLRCQSQLDLPSPFVVES